MRLSDETGFQWDWFWLRLSDLTDETGLPILVELMDWWTLLYFSVSNDLIKMINFPIWILQCDTVLFFRINLLFLTLEFVLVYPLENSGYGVVSVSIKFPLNSEGNAPFSSFNLWLFSGWLGRFSLWIERCSMGGYL